MKWFNPSRALRAICLLLLASLAVSAQAQSPLPESQPNIDLLTNGEVFAVARQANGSLVIGGRFSQVGGTPRANIARITSAGVLDASFNPGADGAVHAIAIDGSGNLYVGGAFTSIGGQARNRLARLSSAGVVDSVWNPNANGTVHALALSAQGLYVGGEFSGVGGGALQRRIARVALTGSGARDTAFSPILNSGAVLTIAVDGSGNVYIGGSFGDVQAVFTRARLAKLSSAGAVDATWLPQPNDVVRALLLQGSQLYVGGDFTEIGAQARWRIARLSTAGSGAADATWNPNSTGSVYALGASSAGDIYAAGSFTQIGGQFRSRLAKLNATGVGTAFADWNPGADGLVRALSVDFDGSVAAGGLFSTAAGQVSWSLLRLTSAAALQASPEFQLQGTVYDIGVQSTGGMIVGGNFLRANGIARRHLLRLDANHQVDPNWIPDPNGPVRVTTMSGAGVVYLGGEFTQIGGQARNRLARMSTSGTGVPDAWNPSANGTVHAILINSSDNSIMVGGEFTQVGGQTRGGLAKLSNSGSGLANLVWNPGTNGAVYAFVQRNNDLYIGGAFSTLGGQTRNNVGRVSAIDAGAVNGTWNPNANGPVHALASTGDFIYVGGSFFTIGGQNHAFLTRINWGGAGLADTFWGPFSTGGSVRSLVVANGLLYVGGDFGLFSRLTTASGQSPAPWNPTANAPVNSLRSTTDGLLLVGGEFTSVSGQPRKSLAALARLQPQAALSITPNTNPIQVGGTTSFTVTGGSGSGASSITVTEGGSFCSFSAGLLTGLAAGTCTVTATKAGDATYMPASATTTVTVTGANQAPLTVTATPSTIVFGGSSALSTTGGSGAGAVTYAITAGGSLCSVSGSTLTGIGVGSCTVTATKAGSGGFLPTSGSTTVTVTRANQAALSLTANPANITVGATSALSTSGGSGSGAVSYAITAGAGFCSLAGSTVTGTANGNCTITATKAADANHNAATATTNITVGLANQAPLTVTATPSTIAFGGTSLLSTTGGSGAGSVSYSVTAGTNVCSLSGGLLTGIGVGICTVTATKAGDGTFAPATAMVNVAVVRADQAALSLVASPPGIAVGATSTLSTSGGSGSGAVTYAITAGASFCSLSGGTVTGTAAGSCTISATKAADAHYNAATATATVNVGLANQAPLTVTAQPSTLVFGGSASLSTSGGSGTGAVSYAVTAGGQVCSVAGSSLSAIGVGSCTVTATKAGDASFAQATASVVVTVNRAPQAALGLNANPSTISVGGTSSLSVFGGSGTGVVSFELQSGSSFCGLSGNIVTGTAVGSCLVIAHKAGDAHYEPSLVARLITVVAAEESADLQLAIAAPISQALPGSAVVYTIIVSNAGPDAANGARLVLNPPAALTGTAWQCMPSGSTATCPAAGNGSGTGAISALMNLPAGTHLRYDLSAAINAPVGSSVVTTASVQSPAGLTDPNPANNSATHQIQMIGGETIFQNGFEGLLLLIEPEAAAEAMRDALGG